MPPIDYAMLGRKLSKENPELFHFLHAEIERLESIKLVDLEQMATIFESFCCVAGCYPLPIAGGRAPDTIITQRRLFIAVALQLYDPLYMKGYSGKMRANLRAGIEGMLRVNGAWVSITADLVRFEYRHVNTFQLQVNLIVYCIRMNGRQEA